jgi:ERCC4-type nuclease
MTAVSFIAGSKPGSKTAKGPSGARKPAGGKGRKKRATEKLNGPSALPIRPAVLPRAGQPLVLIDDRAGSKDLMVYEPLNTCGQLCRLPSGDAYIVGVDADGQSTVNVGVEVKSVSDFVSSVDNGRLTAEQLPAMERDYDVVWLVVYGRFKPGYAGCLQSVNSHGLWVDHHAGTRAVSYGYVVQNLMTISASGVLVATVDSPAAAAHWLACLARWWSKPLAQHSAFKKFNSAGDSEIDRRLKKTATGAVSYVDPKKKLRAKIAKQFPGIGYDKAVAAAEHFPSTTAMVNATAEEWMELDGVGKVIAKAIVEAVK